MMVLTNYGPHTILCGMLQDGKGTFSNYDQVLVFLKASPVSFQVNHMENSTQVVLQPLTMRVRITEQKHAPPQPNTLMFIPAHQRFIALM